MGRAGPRRADAVPDVPDGDRNARRRPRCRRAKLRGDEITFTAGGTTYTGRVNGNTIRGTVNGTAFTATKK